MNKHAQSVGRPREFDETEVLKKVMDLFWRHGYEGTGLSDIIAATGLAKGSLYKAFGNKKNMYLQALAVYEAIYVDAASDALLDSRAPKERIVEFLSEPINGAGKEGESKGCFLCNASADRADLDEEIRMLVRRGFIKLSKSLRVALSDLNPYIEPDRIHQQAEALLAIYSGLRIMARSGVDKESMEAARDGGLLGLTTNIDR